MIEIINENHYEAVTALFNEAYEKIRIISPFLSDKTAELLCLASDRGIECSFITRFYLQDFLDGSNTLNGLQKMLDSGVKLYALVGLHTKLYLFDSNDAIIGSANFTESGLKRNIELSIHLKNESVVENFSDYYNDILDKVQGAKEGIITQDMLDIYNDKYNELGAYSRLDGGKRIITTIMGATLDRDSREIKENSSRAFEEIDKSTKERLTDPVYYLLGGKRTIASYKNLRNILLKFSASAKERHNGDKPMFMHAFEENGKSIYISNFSEASLNSAKTVEEDDETFFCVHSNDINGVKCPIIVGKGFFKAFNINNDVRRKEWIHQFEWLKEYPIYCVISEAKIIDAPVKYGIPLSEVINALGYKTYRHTYKNPEKYTVEKVLKSHAQRAMLGLTIEAKQYIDKRLDEIASRYGWKTYKSELK